MRRDVKKKLSLHRETLRRVSGRQLRAVAGGAAETCYCSGDCHTHTMPKSTAWTAETDFVDYYC
jgi:hypothetical protein